MARPTKDTSDPIYRSFMCENYEKEKYLRAKWNILHGDLAKKAASLTHDARNYAPTDIYKYGMVAALTNTTKENISSACNRRTKQVKDYMSIKDGTAQRAEPPMKPIEEEVKIIIAESRQEYLKVRNKKAPEDKYRFIETTNMIYGWELGKNAMKPSKAAHGRICPLTNLIKDQHSGPHRDPDHYNKPDEYRHVCFL